MGASFSGSLFSKKVDSDVTNVLQQQSSYVQSSCCTGNTSTQIEQDLRLNLTNLDCANVDLGNQTTTSNCRCTSTSAISTTAEILAKQIAGTQAKNGGIAGSFSIGSTSIDATSSNLESDIKSALSAQCGNEDSATQVVQNTTLNFAQDSNPGVCKSIKILNQTHDATTRCTIVEAAKAMQELQSSQGAGTSVSGFSITSIGSMIVGVVLLLAIIGLVVFLVMHHHRKPIAALTAQVRNATRLEQFRRGALAPSGQPVFAGPHAANGTGSVASYLGQFARGALAKDGQPALAKPHAAAGAAPQATMRAPIASQLGQFARNALARGGQAVLAAPPAATGGGFGATLRNAASAAVRGVAQDAIDSAATEAAAAAMVA